MLLDKIRQYLVAQVPEEVAQANNKKSFENLIAYLACKRHLTEWKIDSLDLLNHKAVLFSLRHLLKRQEEALGGGLYDPITPEEAEDKLLSNKKKLHFYHKTEFPVMVTLDVSMLRNRSIFRNLFQAGMNIARINCAHDDPSVWGEFVKEVRLLEKHSNRTCKIYMDLAGPKIRLGNMETVSGKIGIRNGQVLRIIRQENYLGHEATATQPASVSVNLPKTLYNVRMNDRVLIDDGKIAGKVSAVKEEYIEIKITSKNRKKFTIKGGKGINFPDSLVFLNVPAVTKKDLEDLDFISRHADIIGVSFVHQANDLRVVQKKLSMLTPRAIPLVAKIETKDAVSRLPSIIKEGLTLPAFGIMIARGDLAVEVGFEKMAVIQEEILAVAHSAHIPVIWATQVLENLTKKGQPTRAEISDVYLGSRAQCIMLNKGMFIEDSVSSLQRILVLVKEYQERKVNPFII